MKRKNFIYLIVFISLQLIELSYVICQNSEAVNKYNHNIEFKPGFSENGEVLKIWQDAIHYLRRNNENSLEPFIKKKLSTQEDIWFKLINRRINVWTNWIDSLGIPFREIEPPDTIKILLGNQGGEDAFVYSNSIICFDLSKLLKLYGSANKLANVSRIDRFFAHEYTHVLHNMWEKFNPILIDSPFAQALWICLREGIGNYRSLSEKWYSKDGGLTDHAVLVLSRLQPIFVERIKTLKYASWEESKPLMKGISMGPFDQKWGALTVALWFAQEARGDDRNLQPWIDAGPQGILLLANKYMPKDLSRQLPKYE